MWLEKENKIFHISFSLNIVIAAFPKMLNSLSKNWWAFFLLLLPLSLLGSFVLMKYKLFVCNAAFSEMLSFFHYWGLAFVQNAPSGLISIAAKIGSSLRHAQWEWTVVWEYDSEAQTLITIDSFVYLTMPGRAHGRTRLGADAKINLAAVLIGATGSRDQGIWGKWSCAAFL